ncbi:Kallikrein 1-related peptidase [Seminavis robusta]|uniref:Kallikrein 1-related peptidase n=1 Tax=Seminavis robusta TaxID=568900 RepID=A0A9N8DIZ1_9STRA|nr:Kallikrein 1-related peptidase [Seminavis robusta]|eukprot:Sro108_g054250.1 Kallikrein 1-related peptidase (607) ;mRNA; f:76985-79017
MTTMRPSLAALLLLLLPLLSCYAETVGLESVKKRENGPIPPNTQRAPSREQPAKNKGLPKALASGTQYIIGGEVVTSRSEYPYFVQLPGCGAFLIHDDIALSAAHCDVVIQPLNTRVLVNGIEVDTGIQRTVDRSLQHPLYDGWRSDYDYLVLKLDSSALVDASGNPTGAAKAELNAEREIPAPGDTLTAIGYGRYDNDSYEGSDVLLDVDFEYIDDDTCTERWGPDYFVRDVMFCAGVLEGGGKGSCNGDSGGPVLDQNTGTIVGITSYGSGKECASASRPNVYARVSGASTWIRNTLCELTDYPPDYCDGDGGPTVPDPGPGDVSIYFDLDGKANETGFSFTHDDSGYVYAYATFNESMNNQEYSISLQDLPVGNYTLAVNDAAGDGFCDYFSGAGCQGAFAVVDDNSESNFPVYINDNFYYYYIGVKLEIDNDGVLEYRYETYWPGSSFEPADNYPQLYDELWPGPHPTEPSSVYINLKHDDFPGETRWHLYQHSGGHTWSTVTSYDGGTDAPFNELVSVELKDLESPGWYHFSIEDSRGDGICCYYRRGWVAITAVLEVTEKPGMVWGNNGEFGDGTEIFFHLDENGMVSEFSAQRPSAARL